MSSTLTIEPAARKKKELSSTLKFALKRKLGHQSIDHSFNSEDIVYFEGLRDAGIEDAQTVIEMIDKHGEVTIKEEF